MKIQSYYLFAIALILQISLACEKPEGEGGSSSIRGVVIKQEFNNAGQLTNEYPAPDERVYIIYGEENNIYDDEVRSHFDGRFSFDFLHKGKYQLFAYSECKEDTCANLIPVFVEVEITERNQIVNPDPLIIIND